MSNFCEMCEEMGLDYRCKTEKGICVFEEENETEEEEKVISVTPIQERDGKIKIIKENKQ